MMEYYNSLTGDDTNISNIKTCRSYLMNLFDLGSDFYDCVLLSAFSGGAEQMMHERYGDMPNLSSIPKDQVVGNTGKTAHELFVEKYQLSLKMREDFELAIIKSRGTPNFRKQIEYYRKIVDEKSKEMFDTSLLRNYKECKQIVLMYQEKSGVTIEKEYDEYRRKVKWYDIPTKKALSLLQKWIYEQMQQDIPNNGCKNERP